MHVRGVSFLFSPVKRTISSTIFGRDVDISLPYASKGDSSGHGMFSLSVERTSIEYNLDTRELCVFEKISDDEVDMLWSGTVPGDENYKTYIEHLVRQNEGYLGIDKTYYLIQSLHVQ